jgi:hypothetical protein
VRSLCHRNIVLTGMPGVALFHLFKSHHEHTNNLYSLNNNYLDKSIQHSRVGYRLCKRRWKMRWKRWKMNLPDKQWESQLQEDKSSHPGKPYSRNRFVSKGLEV